MKLYVISADTYEESYGSQIKHLWRVRHITLR